MEEIDLQKRPEEESRGLNLFRKARRFYKDDVRNRILENFLSLSFLQGVNYLLPLITLPYLVRVLGAEKFGLVVFAQVFMEYFIMLTDYGFNLSATRQIALHRDNRKKLAEIYSNVMTIKTALVAVCFGIMSLLVFSFSRFSDDWLLYYLTYGVVVGQAYFAVWFFQGMEKMKYITFLNITARLIFTVFIFILVRQTGDYLLVPFLNSLGYLAAGVISFWIIYRRFSVGISFRYVRVSTIGLYIKEGLFVFLSISSSTLLYRSSVFFIGLLMGYAEVAFYSAAEKIVTALKNIIMVINQTVFPRLSRQAEENTAEYYRAWKKVGRINIAVALLLFTGLIFFANNIVAVLFSEKFIESAWILRLLSVSIISYAVMTMLGLLGMLVLGYTKELSFSQIFPSLAFIIFSPVILKFLSLQTYIVFFLLIEAAIIMHRAIYLRKINFCGWGAR